MRHLSPINQKILLLLAAGITLGFSYSPNQHRRIYRLVRREWKNIDEQALRASLTALRKYRHIRDGFDDQGRSILSLTKKGEMISRYYRFKHLEIRACRWDGKWRFVGFDIPEKHRKSRDALRRKLMLLGFQELQKSFFVLPYECRKEIERVIDFLDLHSFVRFGVIDEINNEFQVKALFSL